MEDLHDELAAALAEGWEPASPLEEGAPVEDAVERVTKLLWRRRYLMAEVQRLADHCAAQRLAIGQWEDRKTQGSLHEVARLEQMIEGHARAILRGSKKRSMALVPGTIQLRKPSAGKTLVVDPEAVIRHAVLADHPEWVERKPIVRTVAVRQACHVDDKPLPPAEHQPEGTERHALIDPTTGERVSGVVVLVETQERFSIADADVVEPDAWDGAE